MSLIVENGTGMANAESYSSVAEADTYFANRGNETWTDLDSVQKEIALRKATDYMLQNYRLSWKGARVNSIQALDWPRYSVFTDELVPGMQASRIQVPSNIVPKEVKIACFELALKTLTGDDLAPDQERSVISETIGPISTTYDKDSPQQVKYRAIDLTLRPFLTGGNLSVKVCRT